MRVEHPDLAIVIRPHPAESEDVYQAIFRGLERVHVDRAGPVGPWLLACALMIHDRCTTGIEAALAGTKVIDFMPEVDRRRNMVLMSQFGHQAHTEDELVRLVRDLLPQPAAEFLDADVDATGHELLANLRLDSMRALRAVVCQASSAQRTTRNTFDERALSRGAARRAVSRKAKRLVRPAFAERQREYRTARRLFPGMRRAAIAAKLARVEQLTQKRLDFRLFGENLLVIQRADDATDGC